ncbi:MAG: hypothetical protein NUV47_01985 [Patescibacteria group bacterium]|nr:hypothetical protein [Patescibacteria group bacterium]
MKYNKGFLGIGMIIAIVAILAVGGGVVYYTTKTPAPSLNTEEDNYQTQANQNNNSSSASVGTPTITVVSPDGGEMWQEGKTYQITWSARNISGNQSIKLVDRNNLVIRTINSNINTVNDGSNSYSYNWIIPQEFVSEASPLKFKILISSSDNTVSDYSNNQFTISAPDNIANWKTYTDSKSSYSIDYPTGTQINANATTVYFSPISTKSELSIDVVMSSSASCFNTASGADPTYATINGINFTVWNKSKEYSTGSNTWATAKEYCVVHGGSIYKIISKLPYKAGTTPSDVDKDVILNKMIASFKFTK